MNAANTNLLGWPMILLAVGSLWAGVQNALAGGGSFITFPSLLLTGLDPRAANITSTVALFPTQCVTGWLGRTHVSGTVSLSFKALFWISLAGGAAGAVLLLCTPPSFFAHLVPYLVAFATAMFAWGSFGPKLRRAGEPGADNALPPAAAIAMQSAIAVYGGYFGGGIGFLMLAALTVSGMAVRQAGATKNVLAAVMNASAVLIFLFTGQVAWLQTAVMVVCSVAGGAIGARMLSRLNEKVLRAGVVLIGVLLTVGLFLKF